MKYVYAVLTMLGNNPIMQTHLSDRKLTGREILNNVVLTDEEKQRYASWRSSEKIIKDLNQRANYNIKMEIQEVEVE